MADVDEIRQAFSGDQTIRIIIDVYTKSLNPENYLDSASKILEEFVPEWKHDTRIRFIAMEVYDRHTFIAIDVNNHNYDFETAHEDTTLIPVYGLRRVRGTGKWVMSRDKKWDKYVADRVADLHNINDRNLPPFLEDHKTVIEHLDLS